MISTASELEIAMSVWSEIQVPRPLVLYVPGQFRFLERGAVFLLGCVRSITRAGQSDIGTLVGDVAAHDSALEPSRRHWTAPPRQAMPSADHCTPKTAIREQTQKLKSSFVRGCPEIMYCPRSARLGKVLEVQFLTAAASSIHLVNIRLAKEKTRTLFHNERDLRMA